MVAEGPGTGNSGREELGDRAKIGGLDTLGSPDALSGGSPGQSPLSLAPWPGRAEQVRGPGLQTPGKGLAFGERLDRLRGLRGTPERDDPSPGEAPAPLSTLGMLGTQRGPADPYARRVRPLVCGSRPGAGVLAGGVGEAAAGHVRARSTRAGRVGKLRHSPVSLWHPPASPSALPASPIQPARASVSLLAPGTPARPDRSLLRAPSFPLAGDAGVESRRPLRAHLSRSPHGDGDPLPRERTQRRRRRRRPVGFSARIGGQDPAGSLVRKRAPSNPGSDPQ